MHFHSAVSMMRGMMSNGQIFSGPGLVAIHVERDAHVQQAVSAAFCRRGNSPGANDLSRQANTSARVRGRPCSSNISS